MRKVGRYVRVRAGGAKVRCAAKMGDGTLIASRLKAGEHGASNGMGSRADRQANSTRLQQCSSSSWQGLHYRVLRVGIPQVGRSATGRCLGGSPAHQGGYVSYMLFLIPNF